MGRLVGIVFFCFWVFNGNGQELSYANVDSLSYSYYLNGKYRKLIRLDRQAEKTGIDFFFMRTRYGITAYNKARYGRALKQFEKAYAMYPMDTVVPLFLYNTYLGLNQIENADDFASKLSAEMQVKLNYNPKKISSFAIETGIIGSSATDFSDQDLLEDAAVAQGGFSGNLLYSKIYLEHRLNSKWRAYQSLGVFRTNTLNITQDPFQRFENVAYNMNYQYNLAFSYQFHKKYRFSTAYGFYKQSLTAEELVPGPFGGPPQRRETTYKSNAHSGCLSLAYLGSHLRPTIGIGTSNLSDTVNTQLDFNLAYHPWSNNRFYVGVGVVVFNSFSNDRLYTQRLGLQLSNRIGIELVHSRGPHYNYLDQMGFLTYNTNNPISRIAGGDLKWQLNHVQILFSYRYQSKTGTFERIYSPTERTSITYKFNSQILTLTAKWNF
jgi:tetratricopeptide (TPR) repeat protein